MTDFYQILKREVETKEENTPSNYVLPNKQIEKEFKEEPEIIKKALRKTIKKNNNGLLKKPRKHLYHKKTIIAVDNFKPQERTILSCEVLKPIWLSLSEAAKLGGVGKKTVKRAIQLNVLKYRIAGNRYQVNLRSAIAFFLSKKKLANKLKENGIGQYIEKWKI